MIHQKLKALLEAQYASVRKTNARIASAVLDLLPTSRPSASTTHSRMFVEGSNLHYTNNSGASWQLNQYPLQVFATMPALITYWPLHNSSDMSGHGQPLTWVGTPVLSQTSIGTPFVSFSGTGQYIYRTHSSLLSLTGSASTIDSAMSGFTIGGWFRFDAIGTNQTVMMSKSAASGSYSWNLFCPVGSAKPLAMVSSNGTATTTVQWGSSVQTNTWYFIVLQYIPSTALRIWVNDSYAENTTSIPASVYANTEPVIIGARAHSAGGWDLLPGDASTAFMCASRLSDDFIKQLYHASRGAFGQ